MADQIVLNPRYIVNEAGEREAVVISMADWDVIQRLLSQEPGSDDVLKSLEAEGISLADLRVCR